MSGMGQTRKSEATPGMFSNCGLSLKGKVFVSHRAHGSLRGRDRVSARPMMASGTGCLQMSAARSMRDNARPNCRGAAPSGKVAAPPIVRCGPGQLGARAQRHSAEMLSNVVISVHVARNPMPEFSCLAQRAAYDLVRCRSGGPFPKKFQKFFDTNRYRAHEATGVPKDGDHLLSPKTEMGGN